MTLDFFFEHKFCSWQQTHRHARLIDRGESTGECVWEIGGDQLVADSGGPGRNSMKTVIAHGRRSFLNIWNRNVAQAAAFQEFRRFGVAWRRRIGCNMFPRCRLSVFLDLWLGGRRPDGLGCERYFGPHCRPLHARSICDITR
jgi:hypothetical protein